MLVAFRLSVPSEFRDPFRPRPVTSLNHLASRSHASLDVDGYMFHLALPAYVLHASCIFFEVQLILPTHDSFPLQSRRRSSRATR